MCSSQNNAGPAGLTPHTAPAGLPAWVAGRSHSSHRWVQPAAALVSVALPSLSPLLFTHRLTPSSGALPLYRHNNSAHAVPCKLQPMRGPGRGRQAACLLPSPPPGPPPLPSSTQPLPGPPLLLAPPNQSTTVINSTTDWQNTWGPWLQEPRQYPSLPPPPPCTPGHGG